MYLICDNLTRVEVSQFVFTGGEVSVKVPPEVAQCATVRIVSLIRSSSDLMALLLVNDAVRRMNPGVNVTATIPYIPYGRQDRVCNEGEAFSLKVAADLINSCGFSEVFTFDPHSDVTPALINNVRVWEQDKIVQDKWSIIKRKYDNAIIVSPDAGANKKALKLCKTLKKSAFIRADKLRDVSTGNIVETVVHCHNLNGRDVLIVDDICDGGMTFIKLAEVLKAKGAGKVGLYVTHGIFSKGKQALRENIDDIYCEIDWNLDNGN